MEKEKFVQYLVRNGWKDFSAEDFYNSELMERELSLEDWRRTFVGVFCKKHNNRNGLLKHLQAFLGKTPQWSDLTRSNISDFRSFLLSNMTANSARVYMLILSAVLNTYIEDGILPSKSYKSVTNVRKTPSQHIALSEEEIERINQYVPCSVTEADVKRNFLIECYSGMRSVDVESISDLSISDGWLTYVSKKTKTKTSVPVHKNLLQYLEQPVSGSHLRSVVIYALRSMCRKCGINQQVELFVHGKLQQAEKWHFVGSHTARRSFATNLALRGVPIPVIAKLMGNTPTVAQGYICINREDVGEAAIDFFN